MIAPLGLIEELALERESLKIHDEYARACWSARHYRAYLEAKRNVESARARIAELEQELSGEETR